MAAARAKPATNMARQIAQAFIATHIKTYGHQPKSVTVMLRNSTVLVTLEGALSSIEETLVQSPTGRAQLEEFHHQSHLKPPAALWKSIRRITETASPKRAAAGIDDLAAQSGVKVFPNGSVVHIFQLSRAVRPAAWSARGRVETGVRKDNLRSQVSRFANAR